MNRPQRRKAYPFTILDNRPASTPQIHHTILALMHAHLSTVYNKRASLDAHDVDCSTDSAAQ